MMHVPAFKTHAVAIMAILLAMFPATLAQRAQPQPELTTRDLWDSNLLSKRPTGKGKRWPTAQDDAIVGITLWRLRPSVPTDNSNVRSLIHEDGQAGEWTPERITTDTPLHEGDKVRISIESARTGYLYVIDCDEYQDGSKGEPYLIFPTLAIRSGDNDVRAGVLIELPAPEDMPPYFKMRRGRSDQSGELLTILVSPKPIEHLQIGRSRLRLNAGQVAFWNNEWKSTTYKIDARGDAGTPYTPAEKAAGSGGKMLTQDDPVPEIMYHVDAKPGEPLMIDLLLQVSK